EPRCRSSVFVVRCRSLRLRHFCPASWGACLSRESVMKAVCLAVLGMVLLYWVPATPAQGEIPAAAQELLKQFEDEAADIEKKTEAELGKRREKMVVELKKVQDELCKEAKLDEAVAVRDLIRGLKAGTNVVLAPDLPAAAREVYKQYLEESADVE